jgi:glycosyltransferase involved in cell wall biosynthesis
MLDAEMVEWLEGRVQPICSTPFIAGELNEYYPGRTNDPAIVYLSTFAIHDPDPGDVEQVRARFGLPQSYILCPTNIGPHKNLISLIRAAGEMKRSGIPFALVLTGSGTQCLGVDPTGEPLYQSIFHDHIDLLNDTLLQEDLLPGRDFWALGYVSDEEMDALVKGATLVAAPSRYEAGSGPALDAWWLGTGVVSSSLQPVLEQIEFLGTEAMLFDATDVNGMAEALTSALTYPEAIAEMAARSQDAMKRYTWSDVARGYVGVFRGAVEAAARYEAMREAIATRLRDRVARDPDVLLALCRLDPGFVADEARLPREKRGLRATVRGIPVLGSLVYSAHTLLRGERGPGDG